MALRQIRERALQTGLEVQLIAIDDGSNDGTWSVLQSLDHEMPELQAIRLSRNFGKEGAIAAGLDASQGDATIILDADLQHPPTLIPEMVRLWRTEGWDVIEAVKTHRGRESWWQRRARRGRRFHSRCPHEQEAVHVGRFSRLTQLATEAVTSFSAIGEGSAQVCDPRRPPSFPSRPRWID